MEHPEKKKILILLGPPGAGKGSQAVLLKNSLLIPHISTGALLRDHIKSGSALGIYAKEYIDNGKLVPDSVLLDMLIERLQNEDCAKGYILDGVPRTLEQAKAIDLYLAKEEQRDVCVINLSIDSSKIIERIIYRRLCIQCQTPYHLLFSPPENEGKCNVCSSALFQREDDTLSIVQNRLKVYAAETEPLIAHYSNKGVLFSVNAALSKEKIFEEILEAFSLFSISNK